MNTEDYKEYINLIFDNYLRKLLYAGTILVSIFLLIRYLSQGDKLLESVMLILGVLIFGELFIQTFRWLFSKVPSLLKTPTPSEDVKPQKRKKNKAKEPKNP
jgi:hypothetical protein